MKDIPRYTLGTDDDGNPILRADAEDGEVVKWKDVRELLDSRDEILQYIKGVAESLNDFTDEEEGI